MRTNEVRLRHRRGQCYASQPANLAFHTANIGDYCPDREVRRDLSDERYNLIHRCADDHQLGIADGLGGSISDAIAPWLVLEL